MLVVRGRKSVTFVETKSESLNLVFGESECGGTARGGMPLFIIVNRASKNALVQGREQGIFRHLSPRVAVCLLLAWNHARRGTIGWRRI
jgi:hypothetical protein